MYSVTNRRCFLRACLLMAIWRAAMSLKRDFEMRHLEKVLLCQRPLFKLPCDCRLSLWYLIKYCFGWDGNFVMSTWHTGQVWVFVICFSTLNLAYIEARNSIIFWLGYIKWISIKFIRLYWWWWIQSHYTLLPPCLGIIQHRSILQIPKHCSFIVISEMLFRDVGSNDI